MAIARFNLTSQSVDDLLRVGDGVMKARQVGIGAVIIVTLIKTVLDNVVERWCSCGNEGSEERKTGKMHGNLIDARMLGVHVYLYHENVQSNGAYASIGP